MNWVTSQLAIADLQDLDDVDHVRRVIHEKIDVRDAFDILHPHNPIPSKINDLVDRIQDFIDEGLRVMIYCTAGMDRSPFVAATYLVKTEHLSYGDAYVRVKRERPQTITHFEWAEIMSDDPPVELKLKPKGKKLTLNLGERTDVDDTPI